MLFDHRDVRIEGSDRRHVAARKSKSLVTIQIEGLILSDRFRPTRVRSWFDRHLLSPAIVLQESDPFY